MKKKHLMSLVAVLACAAPVASFAQAAQADNALLQAAQKRKDVLIKKLGKSITPVSMRYGTDAGFAYHPETGKRSCSTAWASSATASIRPTNGPTSTASCRAFTSRCA